MAYLFYSALFGLLLIGSGAGFARLLVPGRLRRYSLLFSPIIGYCYLTLGAWYLFAAGFPGTNAYGVLLLVLPAAFLSGVALESIRDRTRVRAWFDADVCVAYAVAIVGLLVFSLPFVTSGRGVSAASLGNADIADQSVMARYLQAFSMNEPSGFLAQNPLIVSTAHNRFGSIVVTALASSLFGLETYQLQNIATSVFVALVALMTFVCAREVFGYSLWRALLGTGLLVVNPILYYTAAHNFQAQIVTMALAIAAIVLSVGSFDASSPRDRLSYLPLTMLVIWGISVTYGHMLFPLIPAIALHVLLLGRLRGSRGSDIRWLRFFGAAIGITALLSFERVRMALAQLTQYGGQVGGMTAAPGGWFVPFLVPSGMFTMPDAFPWVAVTTPGPVRWTLAFAVAVPLIAGWVAAYRGHTERFCAIAAWLAVGLGGATVLAFAARTEMGWGGYASYKWLSFFLPLVLLCLVAPVTESPRRPIPEWIQLASVIFIGVIGGYNTARELDDMTNPRSVVTPEMAALSAVEADSRVDSVNILGAQNDTWNTMWRINFLLRKELYPEWPTYYRRAPELAGRWDLVPSREVLSADGVLSVGLGDAETIPINRDFLLVRADQWTPVRYGSGWYMSDGETRWMGNGSASADLFVYVRAPETQLVVAAEYRRLNAEDRLSMHLDGMLVAQCPDATSCLSPNLVLSRGIHRLEFRAALPPAVPAGGDPRTLSHGFDRIVIAPVRHETSSPGR